MTPSRLRLATTVAAALLLGACATPPPAAASAPQVEISLAQDAAHRLLVRYRAPDDVSRLDFLLADERSEQVFRKPFMEAVGDCGALVPGGVALRHGPGCEGGALFRIQPRELGMDAMYEPAQPSSDGGVLLFTGYYAATAPHATIRWRFTPSPGDYGVDAGGRHDAAWEVTAGDAWQGATGQGDQRHSDEWLVGQHAQHAVYLGHSPITQVGKLLWVRDPALPPAIVDTVGRAGPRAWDAYARASGRQPAGGAAIVMLSAPSGGHYGYHGDHTAGDVLRLSFAQSDQAPTARALAQWSTFVAHEIAHLWNNGVFASDPDRPWLHEGDAEWIALVETHDAGLMSDRTLADELASRVNACLLVRRDNAAAILRKGRSRQDDPYGCGVALQLLGYARLHALRPDATPLGLWGELHRAHPALDTAGFAQFFDAGGPPQVQALLLDDKTPFASTYRARLAAWLPLRDAEGEPAGESSRQQIAFELMGRINQADCGGTGFTLVPDKGEFVLDADLRCHALPAGAHATTIAGVPAVAQPRAAWRALQRACAADGHFQVGFNDRGPATLACPNPVPDLPPQIVLPDDVLARLGLSKPAS